MKIYCCQEHVELALDVFVDEQESYPDLKTVDNPADLSTICEYCTERAIYIVENT
ncbi:CxxH/CxxC protein [Jeotgalibacillus sp. R-1-5s-1]|uniref:CxxH/CxxC protein n=1 Tax=Jeotgalibacillus sp. R-1-5s-1 TaxID=2555897 RepID=UPI00106C256F|nr:CxxH/CxxC protein [Jeotgalibacillus sp. R-1-5s-1]TFD96600.1 CxxH/CxxC protein [Jeotgalibacillus sp. R-1-5s-1]